MIEMMFEHGLFPNGYLHYIIGGAIIGISILVIYLATGIQAGASGFFSSTLTWVTDVVKDVRIKSSRYWRLIFSLSIISGAFMFTLATQQWYTTEVPLWQLFIGGILVGLGTRYSRGCTSGHGLCGVGALAKSSILATIIFLITGIVVAIMFSRLVMFI